MDENWEGTELENGEVAAHIRKHGTPVHTRTVGNDKILLFYPARGDAIPVSDDDFKDFAGEKTPGGARTLVTQTNTAGVPHSISAERTLQAPGAPDLPSGIADTAPSELVGDQEDREDRRSEEVDLEPASGGDPEGNGDDDQSVKTRTYADLSEMSRDDLEALAKEEGVEAKRTDGKEGTLRKEDFIAALRTDK